jgi:deoxyxylulose-5-phosphate synthase
LNLVNPNQQAVAIAHRTLNDLAIACGIDLSQENALADSEALHFRPILVDVVTEKGTGGYEASNGIKRYHADATGAAPQAPQPASSTGPKEVPW